LSHIGNFSPDLQLGKHTDNEEHIGELTILGPIASSPDEELFLARTHENSTVIVKRLSIAYRYDKKRREVYQRESRLAEELDHPNIAGFIGMEEINGESIQLCHWSNGITLSRLLHLCQDQVNRMPVEMGLYLASQIVNALQYLATAATRENPERLPLHIALRPDTIFLTDTGQCQLTQFSLVVPPSISTSIVQSQDQSYLVYAAPEQCVPGIEPDFRADLYTLGILLFELLTSKPLFHWIDGLDAALIIRRKVRCLHPLLSDVDPDLAEFDDIVTGLLQPLPQNRNQDLLEIAHTFELALGDHKESELVRNVVGFVTERLEDEKNSAQTVNEYEITTRPEVLSTIAEYNSS